MKFPEIDSNSIELKKILSIKVLDVAVIRDGCSTNGAKNEELMSPKNLI